MVRKTVYSNRVPVALPLANTNNEKRAVREEGVVSLYVTLPHSVGDILSVLSHIKIAKMDNAISVLFAISFTDCCLLSHEFAANS